MPPMRRSQTYRPKVVVQAATTQTSSVISGQKDAWGQLVSEGGLGITAVFNALFSGRVAAALKKAGSKARFVNCGFPDVVNSILAALGLPITCGFGNVAILATAFAARTGHPRARPSQGARPLRDHRRLAAAGRGARRHARGPGLDRRCGGRRISMPPSPV